MFYCGIIHSMEVGNERRRQGRCAAARAQTVDRCGGEAERGGGGSPTPGVAPRSGERSFHGQTEQKAS